MLTPELCDVSLSSFEDIVKNALVEQLENALLVLDVASNFIIKFFAEWIRIKVLTLLCSNTLYNMLLEFIKSLLYDAFLDKTLKGSVIIDLLINLQLFLSDFQNMLYLMLLMTYLELLETREVHVLFKMTISAHQMIILYRFKLSTHGRLFT